MNKHVVVRLLMIGMVLATQTHAFELTHKVHRFYGDGYKAVADDMSGDRVSECAVPHKFLNQRDGWDTFAEFLDPLARSSETFRKFISDHFAPADRTPWSLETVNRNSAFWRRRSLETSWSLEKHFFESDFDSFTNTFRWIQSDFETISRDRHPSVYFW